jgi:hypothetical protein
MGTLHAGRSALGLAASPDLSVGSAVTLLLTVALRSRVGALARGTTADRRHRRAWRHAQWSARLSADADRSQRERCGYRAAV